MGHTNVKNTFVGTPKVTGGIWRVPQSIALPTNAYDARPDGAIRLGGVSDEGYTYTSERQVEKKKDWNGDKVRSVQQSKDDSMELTFIEFLNPAVMAEVYGANNVIVAPATAVHGTHITTKSVADVLDHGAYIIDTFDGKVKRRRCIPDGQPDKIDPIAEKPGDWSVYKITWDLFPDAQGVTNYTYTELDDRLVPSAWSVAILGSPTGGTFKLLVDDDPTAGIAASATGSAIKSALEALAAVGSGNVTVTGPSSPFAVTLTNGGVLTADDSSLTGGTSPSVEVTPAT